ncbi:MAG: NADH-quinone oxidoreductase subunit NuoH [Planctomycetota bacterium]|nr:NADH-quinone oxidoreductase subunit NuoH [Planctomycetota bacterium]
MDWLSVIPPFVYIALVAFGVVLVTVAYLILLERKVASWTQDRIGPNRVGPWGLLQPLADGLKMFFKEDYRPGGTDKVLFTTAPAAMMLVVIVAMAVIPWGGVHRVETQISVAAGQDVLAAAIASIPMNADLVGEPRVVEAGTYGIMYEYAFQIADLSIGLLFLVAVLSLAVYGVVVGGWASNNKYSFIGGLRATAQMISYEIPLGLCLLTIVVMTGTLDLGQIVEKQAHYWGGVIPAWNVFAQPLAFLMFLTCIHAEANRSPFDLAEAEQELVGGYHTEYTSMRLGLLLLSEYAEMIVTSSVCVALFFGGWHLPGLLGPDAQHPAVTSSWVVVLLRCAVYFIKVLVVIFVFMWVRWSMPRFRFDQLMMLAWRSFIPLSLVVLLATAIALYFAVAQDESFRSLRRIDGYTALLLFGVNIGLLLGAMVLSRVLPPPPLTNRRIGIPGSRFSHTPVPAAGEVEAVVQTKREFLVGVSNQL